MITNLKDYIEAIDRGQSNVSSFRKVPSQATTTGCWCDLSMASGNPSPNFYSGSELAATTLDGNKGLWHGGNVAPRKKIISELLLQTTTAAAVPLTMTLCDYLMFYPQIDMDSVDPQVMDNTVTLPRYITGEGVRMFLVAQYPYIGGVDFTVTYTNSDGVAGRTTGLIRANTAVNIASFVHTGSVDRSYGAFLPLQSGDRGVRSIDSITFNAPCGGLGALVLVKPLYTKYLRAIDAPAESNGVKDAAELPVIEDGAYLNFIALPFTGSLAAAPVFGTLSTLWN